MFYQFAEKARNCAFVITDFTDFSKNLIGEIRGICGVFVFLSSTCLRFGLAPGL
jgi:hypothetical protein